MRHAFIILAHNEWQILGKVLEYLNHEECDLFLNIDCKATDIPVINDLLDRNNRIKYCGHDRLHWGGYSILKTEIKMFNIAINNSNADYYHIISGQDYPIKPYESFLQFFENNLGQSYFDCRIATFREIDRRLLYFLPYDYYQVRNPKRYCITNFLRGFQVKYQIKRPTSHFPDKIYLGSQWCSMTRKACAFLLRYTKEHPGFLKRLNHTFASEEIYIHTVLLNYYDEDKICSENNLRFIRWREENGNRPANLGEEHFKFMLDKNHFFARKMVSPISTKLMEYIDYYLLEHFHEYESCFDYDNRIAESLVEVMKVLDISSVLVVGDNLIYLDALLGMEILANGICDNDQAFHLAQKMNIAEYCQVVDWTQPIYVEDDDKYDSLLFLNQLGGNNDILSYLGNLSELTSHYMFFIEENMQESLKDTLEKSIASFHLKSNSELSKMLLAEFDMIENLQICVLIKY